MSLTTYHVLRRKHPSFVTIIIPLFINAQSSYLKGAAAAVFAFLCLCPCHNIVKNAIAARSVQQSPPQFAARRSCFSVFSHSQSFIFRNSMKCIQMRFNASHAEAMPRARRTKESYRDCAGLWSKDRMSNFHSTSFSLPPISERHPMRSRQHPPAPEPARCSYRTQPL